MVTSSDIEEAFLCLGLGAPSKDQAVYRKAHRAKTLSFGPLLADTIRDLTTRDRVRQEYETFQQATKIAKAFCSSPHPLEFFQGGALSREDFQPLYASFVQTLLRRDYNAWGIAPFGPEGPDLAQAEEITPIQCKPITILSVVDQVVCRDSVLYFMAFDSNAKCAWILLEMATDWANPKALVFFHKPKATKPKATTKQPRAQQPPRAQPVAFQLLDHLQALGLKPRSRGRGIYWSLPGSDHSIRIKDDLCGLCEHVSWPRTYVHQWTTPFVPLSSVDRQTADSWVDRIRSRID